MIQLKSVLDRVTPLGAAGALLLSAAIPAIALSRSANAAPLTERSLMVSSTIANDDMTAPDGSTYTNLPAGDPRNGQKVSHTYRFKVSSDVDLEGFTIEYCEKAFDHVGVGACAASGGSDRLLGTGSNGFSAGAWDGQTVKVVNATQTGGGPEVARDFDVEANTLNFLTLTLNSGEADGLPADPGDEIVIDFVATDTEYFVNPLSTYKQNADAKGTYFAHIETFATAANASAAFGANDPDEVDDGTVTNNVTTGIGLYTRVQETLNFSVEGEQNATPNGPSVAAGSNCAPLTESGQIKMGDTNYALSTNYAYDAYSYFRLSTNSSNGVSVYYSGDTLKTSSGLDIDPIDPDAAPVGAKLSAPGNEQFGLAVDNSIVDTNVGNGGALTIASDYTDGAGDAGLEGDAGPITAKFAFKTTSVTNPEVIASTSAPNGVVRCDTGAVRYIANISPDTPAGIYQTKINYIASPKY